VSVPGHAGKKAVPSAWGLSTGPRTAEGIERIRQARTVHGRYSAEMRELRRVLAAPRTLSGDAMDAIE
jgi:hypothetical protein